VQTLTDLAAQTDKGIVLVTSLIENLRRRSVILPAMSALERACAEAITRANRRIYAALTDSLSAIHRQRLNDLLKRKDDSKMTWLGWLRQSPARPNSRHMLEHIERLRVFQALDLPAGIDRQVHQNRLLKIAREGGQMTPADLARFETQRRYATLVALAVEGMATVTDEIIDLHDRIIGRFFNVAKHKHQEKFQESGKAINEKVRLYERIGQAYAVLTMCRALYACWFGEQASKQKAAAWAKQELPEWSSLINEALKTRISSARDEVAPEETFPETSRFVNDVIDKIQAPQKKSPS